jgi:hypothetical protein
MRPTTSQPQDAEHAKVQTSAVSAKFQLSRLAITGHIHEQTPMCVLLEIADAHAIKYKQEDLGTPSFARHLLASIHSTSIPSIGEIKEKSELQFVARFVNKHQSWPQSKLIQAYNFLLGFTNNDNPLNKLPSDFVAELQTPDNPFAINACVLYKICGHHRLNINSRTTINQMAYAVRMLRENIESVTRRAKTFIEKESNRIDLINVLMLSHHEIQDPEPPDTEVPIEFGIIPKTEANSELLSRIYENLSDISSLRQRIEPTTQPGAVALAALNYSIDLSKTTDPTREYRALKVSGRNEYKPLDPWMQYWYQKNPTIFDLSATFNPLFPQEFYSERRLADIARTEGYVSAEIEDDPPYELLQIAYVSETFYQGELPNMQTRETPIDLNDVGEVPYGQLLCFGQSGEQVQPITFKELTDAFNRNKNFTNPFLDYRDTVFTQTAINKLKLIALSQSGPNPSIRLPAEAIQARTNLLAAMQGIEILMRNNDAASRALALAYKEADTETKGGIRDALRSLLHVGMYMRGWEGTGDYPVLKAPVAPERMPQVELNVTDEVRTFSLNCLTIGDIGQRILNLPLVIYKDGEYQVAVDEREGLTIGQRMDLIRQGETVSNVNSCIRLSSNWFCASAHKYMICIGLDAPFDIYSLRHIS